MNIVRSINNALSYVSETVFRAFIYSPDQYPNVGVQPFSGDPYSEWVADYSMHSQPSK
ncbi:MAG TPA: isochorismate synthase [Coleofasciculaceae cyanobacterium]